MLSRAAVLVAGLSLVVASGPAAMAAPTSAGQGRWTITTAPSPASSTDSRLTGVACGGVRNCWAVGDYFDGTDYRTLVQHYSRGHWRIESSPHVPSSGDNYLDAVSCLPGGPCWAVGNWTDSNGNLHTLVESNASGSWRLQSSPDAPATLPTRTPDDWLTGVSCLSVADCWAVGYVETPGTVEPVLTPGIPAQTLIEHYNGTSWSVVSSPNENSSENELNAITCPAAGTCWAVGVYFTSSVTGNSSYQTLVERYDGSGWSLASSPNASSAQVSELDGVTCSDQTTCTAVGIHSQSTGPDQTLVDTDSGPGWTLESSPDTSAARLNSLSSVSCPAANDCWAVGLQDSTGQFLFQTLIQQRTATGWTIIPSPDTSTSRSNQLLSVTCPSITGCWAVGFASQGNGNQPLIERYSR
jgi:hypothetical protein